MWWGRPPGLRPDFDNSTRQVGPDHGPWAGLARRSDAPSGQLPQQRGQHAFEFDGAGSRGQRSHVIVPRGPGLGVDVDESVIWRYPWIPGPWSFFRLDSPAGTWSVTADHSAKWSA